MSSSIGAGLRWLRAHWVATLLLVLVAGTLIDYQSQSNALSGQVNTAQQALQVSQAKAARVQRREKNTQSAQEVFTGLQGNLLTGDTYLGPLQAVQAAERASGARVINYHPGNAEVVGALPVKSTVQTAGPKPAGGNEVDQALGGDAGKAPAPAQGTGAKPAANTAAYKRYPVGVGVEGTYAQVIAFARALEKGSPIARIDSLTITPGEKIQLNANVFFYGG